MINVIFNMKSEFHRMPNELIPLNNEYNLNNEAYALGSLSKVNIFIGENNSGKSRFLRHLFRNNFLSIDNEGIDKLYNCMKTHINCQDLEDKRGLEKFALMYERSRKSVPWYSHSDEDFIRNLEPLVRTMESRKKYYFPTVRGVKDYKTILNRKLTSFSQSASSIQNKDSINHYISLLNLEESGLEKFDIYREITIHEYFSNNSLNIVTGGNLYRKIKTMLLGKEEDRRLVSDFQEFLRNNFFADHESVQLIPNEKEKVLYVKIGSDERPIYDWGDGTQQLIIILFYLFIHKDEKDNTFFIEEPEIYLHPGVLRRFIEVINSDTFANHQYFITTHSNIILDTSADSNINMSIFKFIKKNGDGSSFVIEQCNNGDISLLNVLGVRNSSVFLSNCSIWVEGITDRLYLKHYLSLYFKNQGLANPFRENIDYAFIEYGGNNIVHFNFDPENHEDQINAKYISNHIFLIADNDNTREGTQKAARKEHLREVLGEHFYELPVVEVENLLPQKAIEETLIKQNPKYTDLIKRKFAKDRNYKTIKLGWYLDNKLFRDTDLKKYSAASGTIKDKINFCQTAIAFITDYDMLTDETKNLVEKIVGFIRENN